MNLAALLNGHRVADPKTYDHEIPLLLKNKLVELLKRLNGTHTGKERIKIFLQTCAEHRFEYTEELPFFKFLLKFPAVLPDYITFLNRRDEIDAKYLKKRLQLVLQYYQNNKNEFLNHNSKIETDISFIEDFLKTTHTPVREMRDSLTVTIEDLPLDKPVKEYEGRQTYPAHWFHEYEQKSRESEAKRRKQNTNPTIEVSEEEEEVVVQHNLEYASNTQVQSVIPSDETNACTFDSVKIRESFSQILPNPKKYEDGLFDLLISVADSQKRQILIKRYLYEHKGKSKFLRGIISLFKVLLIFPSAIKTAISHVKEENKDIPEYLQYLHIKLEILLNAIHNQIFLYVDANPNLKMDLEYVRSEVKLDRWLDLQSKDERQKFCAAFRDLNAFIQTHAQEVQSIYRFKDNSSFSRFKQLFMKFKGTIPSDYRKKNRFFPSAFLAHFQSICKLYPLSLDGQNKLETQIYHCFNAPSNNNHHQYLKKKIKERTDDLALDVLDKLAKDVFLFKLAEFKYYSQFLTSRIKSNESIPCFWIQSKEADFICTPLHTRFQLGYLREVKKASDGACLQKIIGETTRVGQDYQLNRDQVAHLQAIRARSKGPILRFNNQSFILFDSSEVAVVPVLESPTVAKSAKVKHFNHLQQWVQSQSTNDQQQFLDSFRYLSQQISLQLKENPLFFQEFEKLLFRYQGYLNFQYEPPEACCAFFRAIHKTSATFNLSNLQKKHLFKQLFLCFRFPNDQYLNERTRLQEFFNELSLDIKKRNEMLSLLSKTILKLKIKEFSYLSQFIFDTVFNKTLPCYWVQKTGDHVVFKPYRVRFDQFGFLREFMLDDEKVAEKYLLRIVGSIFQMPDDGLVVNQRQLLRLYQFHQEQSQFSFILLGHITEKSGDGDHLGIHISISNKNNAQSLWKQLNQSVFHILGFAQNEASSSIEPSSSKKQYIVIGDEEEEEE